MMRFAGGDEIGGHQPRPLVQQLEKRMLRIGARRAPYNRPGVVVDGLAVARHALAARFHVELLQERGQQRQRFVIRHDGIR